MRALVGGLVGATGGSGEMYRDSACLRRANISHPKDALQRKVARAVRARPALPVRQRADVVAGSVGTVPKITSFSVAYPSIISRYPNVFVGNGTREGWLQF